MNPSGTVQFVYVVGDILPEEIDDSTIYVVGVEKKSIYVGSNFIVSDLTAEFEELRTCIENYLGSEDFIEDIGTALQAMVTSGAFSELLAPIVSEELPGVVASQIDASVASQITTPVNNAVKDYCDENFSVWSGALDSTLTQPLMAAPSDKVGQLKSALTYTESKERTTENTLFGGYEMEYIAHAEQGSAISRTNNQMPVSLVAGVPVSVSALSSVINSGVTIYYSTDDGSTWVTATTVSSGQTKLFIPQNNVNRLGFYLDGKYVIGTGDVHFSFFVGTEKENKLKSLGGIVSSIVDGLSSDNTLPVIYGTYPGYMSGTNVLNPPTASKEVYTDPIEVGDGGYFDIDLSYADNTKEVWIVAATYDENDDFIARSNINISSVGSFKGRYTPSQNVKKVVFAYRTYDSCSILITKPYNRIKDLESVYDHYTVNASDLETGSIENGTGKDIPNANRFRTKIYIPVKKGFVISTQNNINMNVWEYSLIDKSYIRDNGAWTTSYTVQNDCVVRVMWNGVISSGSMWTPEELIERTTLPKVIALSDVYNNADFIRGVADDEIDKKVDVDTLLYSASKTVNTIGHRGDDIVAPQCVEPAYIMARKRGIMIAENDAWKSQDGEYIMWHDSSLDRLGNMVDINGYLMYTDGTDYYWVDPSDSTVYTYEDDDYVESQVALETLTRCAGSAYGVNTVGVGGTVWDVIGLNFDILRRIDFGVYKGAKYKGTQIMTFEEWVMLCKQLGMEIYIDRKMDYTNEILDDLAEIVKGCGMGDHSSWLGLSTAQIERLRGIIPNARCGVLSHPSASNVIAFAPYNVDRGFFFNGSANDGMTKEAIQLGLNAGFQVEVWYVEYGNSSEEVIFNKIKEAISYGVTGITLDHYRVDDAYTNLLSKYD